MGVFDITPLSRKRRGGHERRSEGNPGNRVDLGLQSARNQETYNYNVR